MMECTRYTPDMKGEWDSFAGRSKNATFLLFRDYMDYHSDRFEDRSYIIREGRRTVALFPANIVGDTVYSHQGLTYGGWIMPLKRFDTLTMLEAWHTLVEELRSEGIRRIIYKAIPHIYHSYPAEEDLYGIFRLGGRIESSLVSTVIDLGCPVPFDQNARRAIRHAVAHDVQIRLSSDLRGFWSILSDLLESRYRTSPVHTLEEITMLRSRFPDNIKLYGAYIGDRMVAGALIYFTGTVAHAQYIASSPEGKEKKVLPMLFDHIIGTGCDNLRYFDFGTSNEDNGMFLNEGLMRQKCGMGGRAIVYDTYSIDI